MSCRHCPPAVDQHAGAPTDDAVVLEDTLPRPAAERRRYAVDDVSVDVVQRPTELRRVREHLSLSANAWKVNRDNVDVIDIYSQ